MAAFVGLQRHVSLHRLRADGYTLRLVAAAAAKGVLRVDLDRGVVDAV